jgi:methyl-accepting chemotaxis protein
MEQVVAAVRSMEEVIARITEAEAGQRSEIARINGALHRIDDMTRQNAALVVQAAAGASRVHAETALLNQALGQFRLGSARPAIANSAPVKIAML